MADNTQQSADENIATDDIGGVKYQRVKVTLGADGVNDADVSSANPMPISAASLPLPTNAAQDGTDITTPTEMPAGGAGIRGWLSAIWTKLNGTIGVSGTFWQATQPVSIASMPSTPVTGTVSVSENNKALVVYESGDVLYVCKAVMGSTLGDSVWQIKKVDTTIGVIVQWCDGNANYDNVATNLGVVAALSYS